MKNSFFILNQLINDMQNIHGIVAYSIFQMPYDNQKRERLFKKILKKNKKIFFACENLKVSNKKDIERIKKIWNVKKISNKCLQIKDLK